MATESVLCECQNCRRLWDEGDLNEVEDLSLRVSPGEPVPYGECPECGAVCHPHKGDYRDSCPMCGEGIQLVSFVSESCSIPVQPDGWFLGDGSCDTSDERFACRICEVDIPVDWVFGKLTRKETLLEIKKAEIRAKEEKEAKAKTLEG